MVRILLVCMGNICRSPIAQSVFHTLAQDRGLNGRVEFDSAGTYAGHSGEKPDRRAIAVATARGHGQIGQQRARRVVPGDFERFDLILAMDASNLRQLGQICPPDHRHKLHLFLEYAASGDEREVPDPYYGNPAGFERVTDLCEAGAAAVLNRLAAEQVL